MITVLLNNEKLDIEQQLLVEVSSAYFESEVLSGGFSYPIKLPLTNHNLRLLGEKGEHEVLLDVDGVFIKSCILSVKRNKNVASGYLKFDLGVLISEAKKNIRELVDDRVVFDLGASNINDVMLSYVQKEPSSVPAVFFPVKNVTFMEPAGEMSGDISGYQNNGYQNMFRYGTFETGYNVAEYITVPAIYLVWTLRACFSKLGYDIVGEFVEDPEVRCWVFDCNTQAPFGAESGLNMYSFHVWKCLPSISLVDLLKNLREFEGVGCFVDSKMKRVELRRMESEVTSLNYLDLRGCELADMEYTYPDSAGYTVKQMVDEDDANWKNKKYKQSYTIGAGEKEIELKIGTVMMVTEDRPFGASGAKWTVPSIERPGNLLHAAYNPSKSYSQDTDDKSSFKLTHEPPLRFLAYRGLVEDSEGDLYPLATSAQADVSGAAIGTRMLRFDGATGQWYTMLEKYYGLLDRGKILKTDLLLPLFKVASLLLLKTKCMLRIDNKERFFLLQKAQINFPAKKGLVKVSGDFFEVVSNDFTPMPVTTPTQMVYVVLRQENFFTEGAGSSHYIQSADIKLYLYLDELLTEPADVSELTVYVKSIDSMGFEDSYSFTFTGASEMIFEQHLIFEEYSDGMGNPTYQYSINFSVVENENYYLG